jgi:hypothetical protein
MRYLADKLDEVIVAIKGSNHNHSHVPKKSVGRLAICKVRGCQELMKYRGICSHHYSAWSQSRDGWEAIAKVMLPPKTGTRGGIRGK